MYIDVDITVAIPVNIIQLVSDTDFKTIDTTIAYNESGMDLVWNFVTTDGTMTQTAVIPTTGGGDHDWTHVGDGMYKIGVPDSSSSAGIVNDLEGYGWFTGVCDGVLPWSSPVFVFRAASLNNSLIDDGATTEARLAELDAANLPADVDAILNDTGTSGVVVAAASKTGYALSAAGVQAIWNALTSALTTVGSIGKKLSDWILGSDNKVLLSNNAQTGVTIPTVTTLTGHTGQSGDGYAIVNDGTYGNAAIKTLLDAIAGYLDTEIAAILEDTGTTIPALIAALNDLSSGDITTALTAYDSPTKAEMDAAHGLLSTVTALSTAQTDITAIKTKTDNLPSGIKKNTALDDFTFLLVASSDHATGKTGLTVTAQRSIDGAAFDDCTSGVTEIGVGAYKINLSSADLNGDTVMLKFTADDADTRFITIVTEP